MMGDKVTEEQKEAIESEDQFVEIIAGPGTGKTFVLAHKIAKAIDNGVDPSRILAASFTNEACDALRVQLRELVGDSVDEIDIFTFHSFSRNLLELKILETNPSGTISIADEWDSKTLLRGLGAELSLRKLQTMSLADLNKLSAFREYTKRLKTLDMVDFRSLILSAQIIAKEKGKDYSGLFVDEFQDTSRDQFGILANLIEGNPGLSVTVVGDPNQAIYGFSRVNFSPFCTFRDIYCPKQYILRGNFRSTQPLVDFTNTQMPSRTPQVSKRADVISPVWPSLESLAYDVVESSEDKVYSEFPIDNSLVREIERTRAEFNKVTVLTFTNKAVSHILGLLKEAKIPYETAFNKSMFEHSNSRLVYLLFRYIIQEKEVQLISFLDQSRVLSKAARDQLEMLSNGFTESIIDAFPSLKRIKNKEFLMNLGVLLRSVKAELQTSTEVGHVRELVKTLLQAIPGASFDRHALQLFDAIEVQSSGFDDTIPLVYQFMAHNLPLTSSVDAKNSVQVRTIHSSKGLEWPAVIMPYLGKSDSHRFYQPPFNDPVYNKALYVGMSRARDSLSILATGNTELLYNDKLKRIGERPVTERMTALKMFPKLFSPLRYTSGPLSPFTARRGLHYLLKSLV